MKEEGGGAKAHQSVEVNVRFSTLPFLTSLARYVLLFFLLLSSIRSRKAQGFRYRGGRVRGETRKSSSRPFPAPERTLEARQVNGLGLNL